MAPRPNHKPPSVGDLSIPRWDARSLQDTGFRGGHASESAAHTAAETRLLGPQISPTRQSRRRGCVCEPDPASHLTAQHHKLMPKRHVLCFKADLQPEWRDQDRKHEAYKRKHHVNLCDSLTSSTRIRFSVQRESQNCKGDRRRIADVRPAACRSGDRIGRLMSAFGPEPTFRDVRYESVIGS